MIRDLHRERGQRLACTLLGPLFMLVGAVFFTVTAQEVISGEILIGGRVSQAEARLPQKKILRDESPGDFWRHVAGTYALGAIGFGLGVGLAYNFIVRQLRKQGAGP